MNNNTFSSKWILRPNPNKEAKLRIFCFPYAGSSGIVTYNFLVDMLPDSIEVCPIELPGHGARISEGLNSNLNNIIEQLFNEIVNFLDKPFVFLGHSMGALISYELAHTLKKNNSVLPLKLYVSAHKAPFLEREGKIMHKLSASEFEEELIKMKGIDKNILEHRELMELVLPIIKNDYEVCEKYSYSDKGKLNLPIVAFGGKDDQDVNEQHLKSWEKLTNSQFELEMFEGDHFFIVKNKMEFAERLKARLLNDINYSNDKFRD